MTAEHRLPLDGRPGLVRRLSGLLLLRPPGGKQRTALDLRRYDDGVSLGKSPTIRDIERLARKAGFRALLSLNTEGEPGELLSPNVEASWAHTYEMQHERVSLDLGPLRSGCVDRFLETLRDIAKPVYVHSRLGRRAAALMTVHLALERGLSGSEALAQARALGIDCALEQLLRSTAAEIDGRAHPEAPAGGGQPAPGSSPAGGRLEERAPASSDEMALGAF